MGRKKGGGGNVQVWDEEDVMIKFEREDVDLEFEDADDSELNDAIVLKLNDVNSKHYFTDQNYWQIATDMFHTFKKES